MAELTLQERLFIFRAERLRLFREQQAQWVELLKEESVLSKAEFRMLHLELEHIRLSLVIEDKFCVLFDYLEQDNDDQDKEGFHDKFRIKWVDKKLS